MATLKKLIFGILTVLGLVSIGTMALALSVEAANPGTIYARFTAPPVLAAPQAVNAIEPTPALTSLTPESLVAGHVVLDANNTILLNSEVTEASTAVVSMKARELDAKLPPGEHIVLVLDTPGGSIDAGLNMIENLKGLHHQVDTLTLFAASMGFQTAEALGTRYIVDSGTLMSHRAKGGFMGEFPGQLESRLQYAKRMIAEGDAHTIARTNGKLTQDRYFQLIREELWMTGKEAVSMGLADQVVTAECNATLAGSTTVEKHIQILIFNVDAKITTANCPLVTGAIVEMTINGKSVNPNNKAELNEVLQEKMSYVTMDQVDFVQAKLQEFVKQHTGDMKARAELLN
jgi:ATP-dependent Clp protease protease subunit